MIEVTVVYQDCVLCGDRGQKKREFFAKKGIQFRKVSAFSDEGAKLVHKAVFNHKIGGLPFYTDGKRFSYHPETFLEAKQAKKTPKKTKKEEVKEDEPFSSD